MTYRLSVRNPKHSGDIYEIEAEEYFFRWFTNSWNALEVRGVMGVSQQTYEEVHNVKLVHNGPGTTISDIVFPSEDAAVMFLLRWS